MLSRHLRSDRFQSKVVLFAMAGALTLGVIERQSEACGGCFISQSENTQVTGHRMALSVSKTQTTLWDQIKYTGNPSEFAWVLPTHGQVTIGLSSDLLFATLDDATSVKISSPQINCAPVQCTSSGGFFGSGTSAATGTGGGVTVVAQQVVGPYETVQLQSTDPQALESWLTGHGYAIPPDVQPIITSYVNEGFDFLALRLVPGQGIDAMKPVRITSSGASPTLPLRMVAAGTGAVTPITLWIMAEGRYQPSNMPSFYISASELVWDWDTQSSNYAPLRKARFDASGGKAWLVESAQPQGAWLFQGLEATATYDPIGSGYGDATGAEALQNATADVDALTAGMGTGDLWVTRISAELSRTALASDLTLGAFGNQAPVDRFLSVTKTTGTTPTCPSQPGCGSFGSTSGGTGGGSAELGGGSSGCAVTTRGEGDLTTRAAIALALMGAGVFGVARRRRRA